MKNARFMKRSAVCYATKYLKKILSVEKALKYLGIKRRRFFSLLKSYQSNPSTFTVKHKGTSNNKISRELENVILKELKKEKELIIDNKDVPTKNYNYSYLRDQIDEKYNLKVSAPTIIKRAKENDFYIPKKERKKHDREVITNCPGELIQHDTSFHKFSIYSDSKWYLITSLDDFSRYMLYAKLLEKETSWKHILALESVILKFGIPLSYYVDCHSIFRFVQGRDSIWRKHRKVTDEATPQWKQVLEDLDVKVIYALSPQAKGKIERAYQWIQDRLVRTCARENIKNIKSAQEVLDYEVDRYNTRQVHSTTKEIPVVRLNKALSSNNSLFREFKIPKPYESSKDIFCLRIDKTVDAYHKVHLNNFSLKVQGVPLREKVQMRIIPDEIKGITELRFWYRNKLVDQQIIKDPD